MVFITIVTIICVILKAVLFNQRGEKAWKALIPFYNKYVLGRLGDAKKLGIINTIFCFLANAAIFFTYYIELVMLSLVPVGTDFSTAKVKDYIPDDLVASYHASQVLMLIFVVIYFFSWALMMRQFSEKNNANTWWILGWAVCPIIGYIYFIFINNYFYTINKELVKYEVKTISEKEIRTINKNKKDTKITKKVSKLRKRKENKDE